MKCAAEEATSIHVVNSESLQWTASLVHSQSNFVGSVLFTLSSEGGSDQSGVLVGVGVAVAERVAEIVAVMEETRVEVMVSEMEVDEVEVVVVEVVSLMASTYQVQSTSLFKKEWHGY